MEEQKKLTAKQQRFVDEYCRDCNATQAAIRAGFSEHTARSQGQRMLTNVDIKAAVDARLKELSLAAAEVTKLTSDIAQGNLSDYFTVKEIEHTPRIEKRLAEVIQDIRDEMEFEEEYAKVAGLTGDELESHDAAQHRRERQIIRLELKLKRNPFATMWMDGPTELRKVANLDMVKLVQDKERGIIKSVKPGEFGLSVEMYARDAALDKLAKMHGLYEKDNNQSKPALVLPEIKVYTGAPPLSNSEKEVDL